MNAKCCSDEQQEELEPLAPPPFPHPLCLFFMLSFNFFANVKIVATTLDKFQFQSQVRLSQINVRIPTPLKFDLYAVFIKCGSRIAFFFVGQQEFLNYSDFLSTISKKATKCWCRVLIDMIKEKCL